MSAPPASPAARIFVALDTTEIAAARRLVEILAGRVGGFKLGKEFFTARGPEGVRQAVGDRPLFLDLKLHDIPNTVAGAMRAARIIALPPEAWRVMIFSSLRTR